MRLPPGPIAEHKQTFLAVPKIALLVTRPVGPWSESMGSRKGLSPTTEALCVEWAEVATHSVSHKAAPVEARPALLNHQVWDFVASISELRLTITREGGPGPLAVLGGGTDEQRVIRPRLLRWQVTEVEPFVRGAAEASGNELACLESHDCLGTVSWGSRGSMGWARP